MYIMTNRSYTSLYTGVSGELDERVEKHKSDFHDGFSKRYRTYLLVYYEMTDDVWAAIEREKQVKGWSRAKKIELIESLNPSWWDLSESLFPPAPPDPS